MIPKEAQQLSLFDEMAEKHVGVPIQFGNKMEQKYCKRYVLSYWPNFKKRAMISFSGSAWNQYEMLNQLNPLLHTKPGARPHVPPVMAEGDFRLMTPLYNNSQ